MKTKSVSFWIDLMPGWQDLMEANGMDHIKPYAYNTPPLYPPSPLAKRVRITVALPCFGGSAEPVIEASPSVDEET